MLNREDILSFGDVKAKEIALRLLERAIDDSDPYNTVKKSLELKEDKIIVGGKEFNIEGNIYALAFGKAACSMAKAVEEILGDKLEEGVAVTKYGYSSPLKKIKVIEAGHPVPDENSMEGALAGVELAKKVSEEDILLVLISGGGSALFCLPEDGISLKDKIRVNELLLKSGAKIHEINTVRKHISKVKGGKLAKLVKGTLISLILSDVVGDNLEAIASGPTVKDPTTFQDAYRILKVYNIWNKLPESVKEHIKLGLQGKTQETLKKDLPNVYNFIIGNVETACESAKKKAEELGLKAYIITTTLEGEAKDVATALGSIIDEVHHKNRPFEKPCVLIAGGETTVTILGKAGLGGPNQEFALSIARKIKGLRGVAVLAADSDGTDGPTDAAGGLVDSFTAELLEKNRINIEEYLVNHNSYEALKRAKALLISGPTRTNVNSIVIAVIGVG